MLGRSISGRCSTPPPSCPRARNPPRIVLSIRTRLVDITESCLDAETLAAWVDGGLTAPELARAQSHVAGCARCQAMVGTLAKITAAVPAPHAEAALYRPHASQGRPAWLGWLAPVLAAAAAVIIYVSIPGSQLNNSIAVAPPLAPQSAAPNSSDTPQARQ